MVTIIGVVRLGNGSTRHSPRLYTYLLAIFAGLALVLASVGLYRVLAFEMSRRMREFGIRIALGALHSQVTAWYYAAACACW